MAGISDTAKLLKEIVEKVHYELNDMDWPWSTLADAAGVSLQTIYKLRDRDYADSPRLSTIVKVAKAVGLKIEVKKGKKIKVYHPERRAG